jgi:enoyl-CoA hydratase
VDPNGVACVTVCNARKLNTLNRALMREFADAFAALGRNDDLRAVILRGEGERAFIGGADIHQMAALDRESARDFISHVHGCCAAIRDLPVPVIARLPGYTLGAGLEIAAACDLRIATDSAQFGMPEVKLGIPSVVEAALLPPLIGWGRARRLLFLGETIGAAEAEAWGLVEKAVAPGELDNALEAWIAAILECGAVAIRSQKALMRRWEDLPLSGAIAAGIDAFADAYSTGEPRRKMQAFLTRRHGRNVG